MKYTLLLITVYILHCESGVISSDDVINDRPIIGVLSQEQSQYLHTKYPEENYTSYIAASYVQDVEKSGARVVPIMCVKFTNPHWVSASVNYGPLPSSPDFEEGDPCPAVGDIRIGKDRSYYREIMSKINGVLFPGGATYFNQSNGYADAGQHILEIAQELNDAGDYFPIFGTCLGFQLMIIIASGRGEKENRATCYSYRNLPLDFTEDFRNSKMFKEASDDVIEILANEDVTVNAHQFCILDDNLKAYNLTEDWTTTSYSEDDFGISFIASIEHKRYPFYGVIFHPEKSSFEWKLSKHYPHSLNAVKANRYFMDFFVKECRKNAHEFASASEENTYLIYNHVPQFTGVLGSQHHQCYFFEPRGTVSK